MALSARCQDAMRIGKEKGEGAMRQHVSRLIALLTFMLLLGWTNGGPAEASAQGDHPPVESHVELPRTFQGVHLGMGRVEVVRTAQKGSVMRASQNDVVVTPRKDRYVNRVEYRFYNGTLYSLETHYRADRIPGGAEALLMRLKETYGRPAVDGTVRYGPAPGVLSEKRVVWNDGRTEIAFVERERDIEAGPEVAVAMTDLQIAQMKEEATRERQRQQIRDVPIPMSDRATSSRVATISSGRKIGESTAGHEPG